MGSCQIGRNEDNSMSVTIKHSSSKQIQSKSSQPMSSGNINVSLNTLEVEQIQEDEALNATIKSRIKKDKVLYNFQEDENNGTLSPKEKKGDMKRRQFRTSVTHSHFDDFHQEVNNNECESQKLPNDFDTKSVKSILKKSNKQSSMSGSPEVRSVHFARGTQFRTKSQRSIKRVTQKQNYPPMYTNERQPARESSFKRNNSRESSYKRKSFRESSLKRDNSRENSYVEQFRTPQQIKRQRFQEQNQIHYNNNGQVTVIKQKVIYNF